MDGGAEREREELDGGQPLWGKETAAGAGLCRSGNGEEAICFPSRDNGMHPWMDHTQGIGREGG